MFDQILNALNGIQSFLVYVGSTQFIGDLKIWSFLITLVFGSLVIFLVIKMQILDKWFKNMGNFLFTSAFPKRHMNKAWKKIISRLNQNDEANLRLVLIEADDFFDGLLIQMKLPGESMADRLSYVDPAQISNIDEILQAHKLRDLIVFNSEYPITRNEIEAGVRAYETALKQLEFIDKEN